ncbi:hypothetical protein [Sinorhizobium meliloti]
MDERFEEEFDELFEDELELEFEELLDEELELELLEELELELDELLPATMISPSVRPVWAVCVEVRSTPGNKGGIFPCFGGRAHECRQAGSDCLVRPVLCHLIYSL